MLAVGFTTTRGGACLVVFSHTVLFCTYRGYVLSVYLNSYYYVVIRLFQDPGKTHTSVDTLGVPQAQSFQATMTPEEIAVIAIDGSELFEVIVEKILTCVLYGIEIYYLFVKLQRY